MVILLRWLLGCNSVARLIHSIPLDQAYFMQTRYKMGHQLDTEFYTLLQTISVYGSKVIITITVNSNISYLRCFP